MLSDRLEELMVGYILDTISPEEVKEVEELLRQNPALSGELAKLEEVIALMAIAAPRLTAPDSLKVRLQEITATDNNLQSEVNKSKKRFKLSSFAISWREILLGLLGILTVYFAFDNYFLRQKNASLSKEVAHLEEAELYFYNLHGTKEANGALGNVTLDFNAGRAYIAFQNLPPSSQGQLYHLWAFTKDKKILCGQFNTDRSGMTISEVRIPVTEYDSPILFMRLSRETPVKNPQVDRPKDRVLVMTSES